jgi:hypothetical protein
MEPDTEKKDANDFRPALEENVRRVVAISALRRIHRLIAERERELRLLRTRVLPIALAVMLVLAVLIWLYFNPWTGGAG